MPDGRWAKNSSESETAPHDASADGSRSAGCVPFHQELEVLSKPWFPSAAAADDRSAIQWPEARGVAGSVGGASARLTSLFSYAEASENSIQHRFVGFDPEDSVQSPVGLAKIDQGRLVGRAPKAGSAATRFRPVDRSRVLRGPAGLRRCRPSSPSMMTRRSDTQRPSDPAIDAKPSPVKAEHSQFR